MTAAVQLEREGPSIGVTLTAFKGGQAKSTTALNFAGMLARRDYRVLLVDCDPQCNTTSMFLRPDEVKYSLRSAIVDRVPVQQVIQKTRVHNLDILPARFELSILDKEMVISPRGVEKTRRVLRPVEDKYRFIIFDTAPGLSHLTLGALVASRYFIIPIAPEVWASDGLKLFMQFINEQQDDEVFDAKLLGLMPTKVDLRTRISRTLLANLADGDLPAFSVHVPSRIGNEDAVSLRAIAGEPGSDPDISEAYDRFTTEALDRIASAERALEGSQRR